MKQHCSITLATVQQGMSDFICTLALLVLILIIFSVWFFTKKVSGFFEEVLSGKSTGKSSSISKSSIKAESVLLATEVFPVFPDELKNSFLVGVGV